MKKRGQEGQKEVRSQIGKWDYRLLQWAFSFTPRSKALPWNALPLWLCHKYGEYASFAPSVDAKDRLEAPSPPFLLPNLIGDQPSGSLI